MFTLSAFSHLVDGLRAVHQRQHNDALMRSLPPETRRDIGWPENFISPDRADPSWMGRKRR